MLRGSTEGSLRAVLSPNLRGSHLPCAFLVALQVLLLLSPSLGLAARLHPFVEDCQFNVPPVPLPAELTGPAFVSHVRALNPDSMHLHSEYLVNFTRRSDNVFFSVAVPSVFRVTVAQDLTADIDLRLYMRNDTLHPIAHSSLMFFTEETIETALNAGDYTLNLRYLTAFASGAQDSLQNPNCAVVELEIALAPIADLQTAAAQLQCPSHDVLPTKAVPPSPLTTGAFHYDSRVNESVPFMSVASYNYTLHPSYVDNVRFFYAIPLQLGDNGGALWGVELRVAFDFVSSGSIGAMLDFDTSTVPTNLRCMDRLVSYETCEIAQNTELNGRTLKWLLPPGNYSLYLYDFYAERMSSAAASAAALPQCAPFEMSLDIAPIMEPENAVTCPAQLFPTALDAVASVSQGYLRFNGDVFMDPVVRRHDVSFAVLEPSAIRAIVAHPEVDVDLLVRNDTGTLFSSTQVSGIEGVLGELDAGNYTLRVLYYGDRDVSFCESLALDVAVSPLRGVLTPCVHAGAPAQPDFTALQQWSAAGSTTDFTMDTRCVFPASNGVPPQSSSQIVSAVSFQVAAQSVLHLELASDFLFGALEATVSSFGFGQVTGSYVDDLYVLHAVLEPGIYSLSVSTARVQSATPSIPHFPSCVPYDLSLSIVAYESAHGDCWFDVPFSSALSRMMALNASRTLSFAGTYRTANDFSSYVSESVELGVPVEDVYIRVYSVELPDDTVRVGIWLREDGRIVKFSGVSSVEDDVLYRMRAGHRYSLQLTHTRLVPMALCHTFSAEVALSPAWALAPSATPVCSGGAAKLPPANVTNDIAAAGASSLYELLDEYFFQQNASAPFSYDVAFVLTTSAVVSVDLKFGFLSGAMNFRLLDGDGTTLATGRIDRDRRFVVALPLAAGSYSLHLYERATVTADLAGCSSFELLFAVLLDSASVTARDALSLECAVDVMPETLDSIQYLSPLSFGRTHMSRQVMQQAGGQSTVFTLAAPAVFHVSLPNGEALDVDLLLRQIDSNGVPHLVDMRMSFHEDSVTRLLVAGSYELTLLYYSLASATPSECATHFVELSLTPLSDFVAAATVNGGACASHPLPASVDLTQPQILSGSYMLSSGGMMSRTSFQVPQASLFELLLSQYFPGNDLKASLVGQSLDEFGAAATTEYYPTRGFDQILLQAVVPAGNYTLVLRDRAVYNSSWTVPVCVSFDAVLALSSAENGPACPTSQAMPVDFFSADGGSASYGGPQASDGSVWLTIDRLRVPHTPENRSSLFHAPVEMYMRVYTQTEPGADLDVWVYSRPSMDVASVLAFSLTAETALFRLPAASTVGGGPFVFELDFYAVPNTGECETSQVLVVTRPVATVQAQLLCPVSMPMLPPSSMMVTSAAPSASVRGRYYFSRAIMQSNTDGVTFSYDIQVDATQVGSVSLTAGINYDFLTNMFDLQVYSCGATSAEVSQCELVVEAVPSALRSDRFNFYAGLADVALNGGSWYVLRITENMSSKNLQLNEDSCHAFDLAVELHGSSTPDPLVPHVLFVSPSLLLAADPANDLWLNIVLSQPLSLSPAQLPDYVRQHPGLLALKRDSDGRVAVPSHVIYSDLVLQIYVQFSHSSFVAGDTWSLQLNASMLSNADGVPFASELVPVEHSYQFMAQSCSGHGQPVPRNGTVYCQCTPPFAGVECDQCQAGYHGSGATCVPDVACAPNQCGDNGYCHAYNGYPVCSCRQGYEIGGDGACSQCAFGYYGFPNCSALSSGVDESVACTEQILPRSLDVVPYLQYDRSVHLSGIFFADVAHRVSSVSFTATTDSALRLYVDAHRSVDVDVYLFRAIGDSVVLVTHDGLSSGGEGSIVKMLAANIANEHYRLDFHFYEISVTDVCREFSMELAVEPIDRIVDRESREVPLCARNSFGMIQSEFPDLSSSVLAGTISQNVSYRTPADLFYTVVQPQHSRGRVYVKKYTFAIGSELGRTAHFRAAMQSQFVEGALRMLIQPGTPASPSVATCSNSDASCLTGLSSYNQYTLDLQLPAGVYTLWFYLPVAASDLATTAPCFVFTLELDITFEEPQATLSDECAMRFDELPLSLSDPGFMDSAGWLHVAGLYQAVVVHTVKIELVQRSRLRVLFPGDGRSTALLLSTAGSVGAIWSDGAGSLAAEVPSGNYSLVLLPHARWDAPCPTVPIEFVVAPSSSASSAAPPSGSCPPGTVSSQVPALPAVISYPFEFSADDSAVYYFVPDNAADPSEQLVFLQTVQLAQNVRVRAVVDSDALDAAMRVEIVGALGNYSSVPSFNRHQLDADLAAGTYMVRVVAGSLPTSNATIWTRPSCIAFHFALMAVAPVGATLAPPATDAQAGVQCGLEPLPRSLNTVRFLDGPHGQQFISHSGTFLAPVLGTNARDIFLTAAENSLLAALVLGQDGADVDIALYQVSEGGLVFVAGSSQFSSAADQIGYTLTGGVTYVLRVSLFSAVSVQSCPALFMQVSVITESRAAVHSHECTNSGSQFPTLPSGRLPAPYYEYDSLGLGQSLYYTPSVSQAPTHQYTFSLTDVSEVWIELSFEFSTGLMAVSLESTATGTVHNSVYGGNRALLSAYGLMPGSYLLTISAANEAAASFVSCESFSLRFVANVLSYVGAGSVRNFYDTMPDDLGGLAFLRLDSDVTALFSFVYLPAVTLVQVQQPTVFRVTRQLPLNLLGADVATLTMKLTQDGALVASGVSSLVATQLLPGVNYSLTYFGDASAVIAQQLFTVELSSLGLNASVALAAAMGGSEGASACATSPVTLLVDPASDTLTFDAEASWARTWDLASPVVAVWPFTLTDDSVVYVQLGYVPPLDALHFEISGGIYQAPYVLGSRARGRTSDLNAWLPAGAYNLTLLQFATLLPPTGAVFGVANQLAHCTPVQLRVMVDPLSAVHGHLDCADFDRVPWDLNSAAISGPFGGPYSGDFLRISGENFLMGGQGDSMSLLVSGPSRLSVLTAPVAGAVAVTVETTAADSGRWVELTPILTDSPVGQLVEYALYDLFVKGVTAYRINMSYEVVASMDCPSLALDLVAASVGAQEQMFQCPQDVVDNFVDNSLSLAGSDRTASAFHAGVLTPAVRALGSCGPSQPDCFKYSVHVDVANAAILSADFAFSSVGSYFTVALYRSFLSRNTDLDSAEVLATSSASAGVSRLTTLSFAPQDDVDADMQQHLSTFVSAGNYTLMIMGRKLIQAPLDITSGYCFPYVWNVQLLRYDQFSTFSYVSEVVPAGAVALSPSRNLQLDVSFSRPVYASSNRTLVKDADIARAFYLAVAGAGSMQIPPTTVERLSVADVRWRLVFDSQLLQRPRSSFTLELSAGVLFGYSGDAVVMPSQHEYRVIDTRCSGHGTLGSDGRCVCESGYSGDDCNQCAVGYTHPGIRSDRCCLVSNSTLCPSTSDFCGCQMLGSSSGACSPLGFCDASNCTPVCKCKLPYTGAHCEQCATGYSGWPRCEPRDRCNPECVRGECDRVKNQCTCPRNWNGSPICDVCTPGWTGVECDEYVGTEANAEGTNDALAIIFLVVKVLGILLSGFVVIGTMVWVAWWRFKKVRNSRNYLPMAYGPAIEMDDVPDDDDADLRAVSAAGGRDVDDDDLFDPRA